MKPFLFLFAFVFGALTACGQQDSNSQGIAKAVEVREFVSLMKSKPGTVLDVRTKGEIEKGAIPGSVAIDFFDDTFESRIEKLDKNKPVYVYCASGGRSGEAMELMHKKGFAEVYSLEGGYGAWMKYPGK